MKRKCVLGVLKTELGLKIKEEMLAWLSPLYDVITIEQEAPGVLYEYPGIKMAASIAVECNEPVLYLHTKGAAMDNAAQPIVRNFWKREFGHNSDKYFKAVEGDKPLVSAPITNPEHKVAWFNAFVINPAAAKDLMPVLYIQKDRYWFEQEIWKACPNTEVIGVLTDKFEGEKTWGLFMQLAVEKDKIAVLTIAKNEAKYIKEWIDYHRDLGVDRFFIINNDEPDNDEMQNIITENNKNDIIQMRIPGAAGLAKIGMQEGAYNAVLNQVIRRHNDIKWLAVIDIDEFLHLGGMKIKDYLNQDKFNDTDVIHLNWRLYGDNGNVLYEDRPVQDRFTKQCPLDVVYNNDEAAKGVHENMFVKSIIRISDKKIYLRAHQAFAENGICRRGDGQLSDMRYAAENLNNDVNYVKHYNTKSLEEYIDRRCIPSSTDVAYSQSIDAKTRLEWYFTENEKTPEKVAYVKERLGIDV